MRNANFKIFVEAVSYPINSLKKVHIQELLFSERQIQRLKNENQSLTVKFDGSLQELAKEMMSDFTIFNFCIYKSYQELFRAIDRKPLSADFLHFKK